MLAASYEAKAHGVRTAMGGGQARRLCPQAVVVPPRMSAYSEASKAVFEVFDDTTPLVEGLSIDEAFLDVARPASGSRARPTEIASRLRRAVLERVGLPITVGVARTKFLAKVASGVAKPDGLLVVPPDGELAFLHPLPVERLWGVGPVTARQARTPRASRTVGEVAALPEAALVLDARPGVRAAPARAGPQPRSAAGAASGGGGARSGRSARWAAADARPTRLDAVAGRRWSTGSRRRMRAAGRVGRTVMLRLRFDDFTRATRSHTLPQRDRRDASDPRPPRGGCSRPRGPRSSAAGSRSSASPSATSTTTAPSSSRCRSTGTPTTHSTPRSTTSATGSGRRRSPAPCCSAATAGPHHRCCRIELGDPGHAAPFAAAIVAPR